MKNLLFILLATLSLVFFSCEKLVDDTPPSLSISSPSSNQQVNGGDTLFISGVATDENKVSTISISLRDNNDIPVLPTITLQPNEKEHSFNTPYFFNDLHMPSGQYYFSIQASDGNNSTSKYIYIQYGEIPKTRTGVFFFDSFGGSSSAYQLNNSNATLYKTVSGDLLAGAANSFMQHLIFIGEYTAKITAIDLAANQNAWTIANANSSVPYYTNTYFYDKELFVCTRDGEIKAYKNNGSPSFYATVQSSHYSENVLYHDNIFFSEEKAVGNNNRYISAYWTNSGTIFNRLGLNEDVVGLYAFTPNKAVMLANDYSTNDGKIYVYDAPSNTKTTLFNLSSGAIDACEEISTGIYLIAQNGNLVLVNANNYSTLPYLSGINANKIKYDAFSNELYVIDNNIITAYDFSSKNVLFSYTHTSTVVDLVFLFNK